MPRRKQQAPKRAAAYSPDDCAEQTPEGGKPMDPVDPAAKLKPTDTDVSSPESEQDACTTDPSSSPDLDSESHLSEHSDRLSDFDSMKNEELTTRGIHLNPLKGWPQLDDPSSISPGSLEQMKAIYSSFLTNTYWSAIGLSLRQPTNDSFALTPSSSTSNTNSNSSSGSISGSISSANAFDWHQLAMAKTLQQALPNSLPLVMDPSLLNTIHIQRQNTKLYGSIFSGASKFRCKGCSSAYETLVELTVHMNETGHYRDDNQGKDGSGSKCWSKPRKRSLMEMEGKEDAQKVLRCMYCGHSFESLQDLSVHMIKTKHYQKVPLKEPTTAIAAKMVAQSRKRSPAENASPQSKEKSVKEPGLMKDQKEKPSDISQMTSSHHGNQGNGSGGTWQFDSHKSQILKCMECGVSHDSLQELTAHMLVTGHFINVTNISTKKAEPSAVSGQVSPMVEKAQSVPLPPSAISSPVSIPSPCMSPSAINSTNIKQEDSGSSICKSSSSEDQKVEKSSKYNYLTEEDLKESPKVGSDILKSLENTVTSAIHKAQTGSPSWGGYQSIHAAYQLPSNAVQSQLLPARSATVRCPASNKETLNLAKNQPLTSPTTSHSPLPHTSQLLMAEAIAAVPSPLPQAVNLQAMQELVRRVTEKMASVEKQMRPADTEEATLKKESPSPHIRQSPRESPPPPCDQASILELSDSEQPFVPDSTETEERAKADDRKTDGAKSTRAAIDASTAIITNHSVPEQPFVNPLSALQSVMNLHLGKVAKPAVRDSDPMSMLFKMSNSMADKVAVATPPPAKVKKSESRVDWLPEANKDQPIDLSNGKSNRPLSCISMSSAKPVTTMSPVIHSLKPPPNTLKDRCIPLSEACQENALADISDMVRNLTQSQGMSKAAKHNGHLEKTNSDRAAMQADSEEEISHRRKGRQSNWNLQHLLILQAHFTASLRRSADGKYVPPDLSLKERTHISHITGLSMTTISHWLANVKYQLRRSGRTKFLKNLDSGKPLFFCSQCSSQLSSPSAYVGHLEAHMGFSLKDLDKISGEKFPKQVLRTDKAPTHKESALPLPTQGRDGTIESNRCKICKETFTSKHEVRLHLCKAHGQMLEDPLSKSLEMET